MGRGNVTGKKTSRATEATAPELTRGGLATVIKAGQVVSGGGESPFDADCREAAPPDPAHAALLLQDSKHRLD